MMQVNLISDTVTRPTPAMLEAMMAAKVGDDVFAEDPSINALEQKAAGMFGKAAAMFCPSGTMTNQIAIKTHTQPLDEMICDHTSHVYKSEAGGYGFNSGIGVTLVEGDNGKITADQVEANIKPHYDWLPRTSLVVLENTCNFGGGNYYTLDDIKPIKTLCENRDLKLHLDGARLFNALVETEERTQDVGAQFDSISICLSKGLGAPVGSLLLGEVDFIKKARRFRKVMGGGMRQAGYLAAAGIYALENNVERLRIDNKRANDLGKVLAALPYVENVRPVKTNIIIFDVKSPMTSALFLEKIKAKGINAAAFGPQTVRFVLHLDVSEDMLGYVREVLLEM